MRPTAEPTRGHKVGAALCVPLTLAWMLALAWGVEAPNPLLATSMAPMGGAAIVAGFLVPVIARLGRERWPPRAGTGLHLLMSLNHLTLFTCFGLVITLALLGHAGAPAVSVNGARVEGEGGDWMLRGVGWLLAFVLDYFATASWLETLRSLMHLFFEFPPPGPDRGPPGV